MDTDVQDIFLCVKHKIPAMLAAAGGAILNAFSLAGPMGFRDRRVYSASKHAVARLTSSTALEVARRGVRVNAACPAAIEEAMNHLFPPCQILMLCGSFRQRLRPHVKCQRSNLANG